MGKMEVFHTFAHDKCFLEKGQLQAKVLTSNNNGWLLTGNSYTYQFLVLFYSEIRRIYPISYRLLFSSFVCKIEISSFCQSVSQSFIHSFVYSFIYPIIYSSIHSYNFIIHSFMKEGTRLYRLKLNFKIA